jgi:beta-lactamase class A
MHLVVEIRKVSLVKSGTVDNRSLFIPLRWISIFLIFLAVVLTVFQLVRYSRIRAAFPPGYGDCRRAGWGAGPDKAAERMLQTYTAVPVEVRYRDAVIQIKPA